jgi:endogenous inhibitor of DNA gyrase (YacG/DUF329 family)
MPRVGRNAICVYCRRHPVDPEWQPFCSERCRLMDLGRWLDEGYRVPTPPQTVESDESTD